MTKEEDHEDFKLLKVQSCVLKVNIHCDGCKHKVKKILHRIEGVYQVNIEQQKVTVSGIVDCVTLVKKLANAGKYAEPWPQNQNPKKSCIKKDVIKKKNNKGQKHNNDNISVEDLNDKEMQLIMQKINQLSTENNNAGKRVNPNPGGAIDEKTLAALKMSNEDPFAEGKIGNDISNMMNFAGFHGNGPNNVFQGRFPGNGLGGAYNPSMMMMNIDGYNQLYNINNPSMMNMENRHIAYQQPHMMFNRSASIYPSTGYCHGRGTAGTKVPYGYTEPGYGSTGADENTSGCSVM